MTRVHHLDPIPHLHPLWLLILLLQFISSSSNLLFFASHPVLLSQLVIPCGFLFPCYVLLHTIEDARCLFSKSALVLILDYFGKRA